MKIAWTLILPSWGYPALEVAHIIGVALLLGNLVALECRVFGLGAALDLDQLARLSLTLAVGGFALIGLSGLFMFMTQATEFLSNRAFLWKMGLITLGGINAAVFHARDALRGPDRAARAQMLLSTVIWVAVIACGRWIAYV